MPVSIFWDPDSSFRRELVGFCDFSEVNKEEEILNYLQIWWWVALIAWSGAIVFSEKRLADVEALLWECGGVCVEEGVNPLRKIICIAAHFILLFLVGWVELWCWLLWGIIGSASLREQKCLCRPLKTIAIPSTYPKPEKGEVAELPVLRPPQVTSIRLLKSFALSLKSY